MLEVILYNIWYTVSWNKKEEGVHVVKEGASLKKRESEQSHEARQNICYCFQRIYDFYDKNCKKDALQKTGQYP